VAYPAARAGYSVTAETAGSSPVVPAIYFNELSGVTPKTPTHNPTHSSLTINFDKIAEALKAGRNVFATEGGFKYKDFRRS